MSETPQSVLATWLEAGSPTHLPRIREAIRAVLAEAKPCTHMEGYVERLEAERDALREKLEEKGRVFSENLLMQGEEITRLRADNLSWRLRDQTEQEQEIARLLAERDALRATLTEETQKRLRAESEEQQQRTYARNCGEQLATLRAEVERRKADAALIVQKIQRALDGEKP